MFIIYIYIFNLIYVLTHLCIYGLIGSCSYSLHLSRHRKIIKRVIFAFKHWEISVFFFFMEVLNGQTLGTKWGDCQLARSLLKPEANQQKPLDLKLLRFYQQKNPSNWPKADHNHPLLFANTKGRYQPEHN